MHHITHPLGDNSSLTNECRADQLNSEHLRRLRADQPFNHRRLSIPTRFGLSVGIVAAVIGIGVGLPNSSDDTTRITPADAVPANVR